MSDDLIRYERDHYRGQRDELLKALKLAVESIADWAGYAGEYYRDKHGLESELQIYRAIIAKIEGE